MTKFHEMDQLVVRFAEASREQSESIQQLDPAFGSMQDSAERSVASAASAEQSASAAGAMDTEAIKLDHLVEEVRQLVGSHRKALKPTANQRDNEAFIPPAPVPPTRPRAHTNGASVRELQPAASSNGFTEF